MRKEDKIRNFARKLLALSVEDGRVSPERVEAILEHLRNEPMHRAKPILKHFMRYINREMKKTNAVVEYSGSIDKGVLKKLTTQLSDYYNINVEIETEENPALLAGLKVHIGDDVWDDTVSGHLATLKDIN